jgi:tripartite-type tricarboxylate transporter receptor subunit TctC
MAHAPRADAQAAPYPNKTIRVVVPYAPGGGVDLVGRAFAQQLSEQTGQSVVIDNRPGAGAMIGVENVIHSAPDGYTLLVVDPAVVISPTLQAKPPYALKDLVAISTLTVSPLVLSVNAELPITDVPSLVAYAKKQPGGINYASAGVGTTPHMAAELLALRTGAPLVHVPYKGSGPAMADLVAGHVQMAFSSVAAANSFIKDGKLRGLATSGAERTAFYPQYPTVAESGVANFKVLFWQCLFAPAGVPPELLAKLNDEAKKVLASPKFLAALDRAGEVAGYSTPADTTKFVQSESETWAGVIKEAKITP